MTKQSFLISTTHMKKHILFISVISSAIILASCATTRLSGSREAPATQSARKAKGPTEAQVKHLSRTLAANGSAPAVGQAKPVVAATDPKKVPVAPPAKPIAAPQPGVTATPVTRPAPAVKSAISSLAAAHNHIVKPGDTLTKLASANGVTESAIKSANSLKSDILVVGTSLVIPAK